MDRPGYFLNLGLMDYGRAWDLQHLLWHKRVEGLLPDLLLFLEHPHVFTLGRRGNRSHLLVSQETLTPKEVPVFHIERGGDITYHGPGQLVAYPIFDLKAYGYRVVKYIDQLEEVILRTLDAFGIDGRRDPLNRGVWVGKDKIASVGVAVKRWVSFHGLALNYETDLSYFDLINPCGLQGIKMTSMEEVLETKISPEHLREKMHFHFEAVFGRPFEKKDPGHILTDVFHDTVPQPSTADIREVDNKIA
jgi:lipoate-protein ligase B